jgi:hypothetical protein
MPKMKSVSVRLTACLIAFAFGVACFVIWNYGRPSPAPKAADLSRPSQTSQPEVATPDSSVPNSDEHQPQGPIGKVDFYNFTYPSPSAHRRVRIHDGELSYPTEPGCGQDFSVEGVDYIDFTGDGQDEALVRFIDHRACGSSWASVNYFVYTMLNGRPHLLWSFATGSEAYGGEKNFRVENKELVLKLYGSWNAEGDDIRFKDETGLPYLCDRCTNHYTIYRVAWDGTKFRRKSLQVVSCPNGCFN